jgi:hypothetical protein
LRDLVRLVYHRTESFVRDTAHASRRRSSVASRAPAACEVVLSWRAVASQRIGSNIPGTTSSTPSEHWNAVRREDVGTRGRWRWETHRRWTCQDALCRAVRPSGLPTCMDMISVSQVVLAIQKDKPTNEKTRPIHHQ